MTDKRFEKTPCTKCGTPCYHLCYIGKGSGEKLVCQKCFAKACEKGQ